MRKRAWALVMRIDLLYLGRVVSVSLRLVYRALNKFSTIFAAAVAWQHNHISSDNFLIALEWLHL